MGGLVWVMVGIALWHFSVFVPDRFWAGIIGAFLGASIGAFVSGLVISGFDVPGNDAMDLGTALISVPGALLGMGLMYLIGMRQDRLDEQHRGGLSPRR